jgi:hypothetical protein
METLTEISIELVLLALTQSVLLLFRWKLIVPVQRFYQKAFNYDGFHQKYNEKLPSNYPFKPDGWKKPDKLMPDYIISYLIFGFVSLVIFGFVLGLIFTKYQINIIAVLISAPVILFFPKAISPWHPDLSYIRPSILIGNLLGLTAGYYIIPKEFIMSLGANFNNILIHIQSLINNLSGQLGNLQNAILETVIDIIVLLLIQRLLISFKSITIWPLHKFGCRLIDNEYGRPNKVTTFSDGSYYINERYVSPEKENIIENRGYFVAYFSFGVLSVIVSGILISLVFSHRLNIVSIMLGCILFRLLFKSFFNLKYWERRRKPIVWGTVTGLILGYLILLCVFYVSSFWR